MTPFGTFSWAGRCFIASVALLGLAVIPVAWAIHPLSPNVLPTLIYLGVGAQIAALMPIRWRNGQGIQHVHDPLLVAAGLLAPGAGVALLAWVALYDGRRPGREASWWSFWFNRGQYALTHGIPSLAVTFVPTDDVWSLPAKTLLYVLAAIAMNYPLTGRAIAYMHRAPFLETLRENIGL